jgi:cellulose synthase/poly-beta-1,6-N-acetylglucosamine synthase-like glycosyltransferase
MGDSICFKSEVLKELKLGSGLTEDYELRLRLLLEGISIQYEPRAVGCGQAPLRWQEAQAQRLRWARGAAEAGKSFRGKLLRLGLKRADWRLLDGFLSISLPSFSALTIISTLMMALSILFAAGSAPWLAWSWAAVLICLFLYPMFGLGLEGAPSWAYLAVLTGPVFMVWRSWINLTARLRAKNIAWVRTPHRG